MFDLVLSSTDKPNFAKLTYLFDTEHKKKFAIQGVHLCDASSTNSLTTLVQELALRQETNA